MRMSWGKAVRGACLILMLAWLSGVTAGQESRRQKPEESQQQNQYRDQAQDTLRDQQQKETQSYPGKISEKFGKYYLEDASKRTSYLLEGTWEAKKFLNKKVRVTGALDTDREILHVITIAPMP